MTCKLKLQNKGLFLKHCGAYLCLIRIALDFPYICLQFFAGLSYRQMGSCLLWVMSTEISVDTAVDIAVDSRSIVGR